MVSISIACYNNISFTKQCISSILRNTKDFEIILIDNNSTDGTSDWFKAEVLDKGIPGVLIQNSKNAGFAYAHNQASKEAKGEYFVPLNNDTIVLKGWLETMKEPFSDVKTGMVGSKLLMPGTKRIQHIGVHFLESGIPYHKDLGQEDIHEFDEAKVAPAVTAACMMMKTDLFKEVGGFDEEYVNGWEDIDLNLKLRKMVYVIYVQPKSVLYHYEGQTEGRLNNDNENRRIFLKRWHKDILEWGNSDYNQYKLIKEKNDKRNNPNV